MMNGTITAVCLLLVLATAPPSFAADPGDIAGDWTGTIDFSGMSLRIVFHLVEGEDGALSATIDSPDQGAAGIPVSEVLFDGDSLVVRVAAAAATYFAVYSPDSLFIEGEWRQAGFALPLRLRRSGETAGPARPQEPVSPFPYREEEVRFDDVAAGVRLAGTLTVPAGEGPFPAAVLISGSGPQDRDESVMGHRPFLVLSDHLTRHGIVVLRYDDRGVGDSSGDHGAATTADFAADARAAFEYLVARKEVDAGRAGLVGHSEGGIIASMVAADDADVGFIVMLAGPGLRGADVLLRQNVVLLRSMGAPESVIVMRTEQLEREYALVLGNRGDEETEEEITTESISFLERYSPQARKKFGFSEDAVRQRARVLVTPWFRFFLQYDPASALRRVRCPVLAMIGEKDMQVDPRTNLPAIERALEEGGNDNHVVMEMPGLNHLFQSAVTGSPAEYARIEETMSPAALDTVSGWILSLRGRR